MYKLLTFVAILFATPVFGQSVFRASQEALDLQNRITEVEAKQANLETYHSLFAKETSDRLSAIENQLAKLNNNLSPPPEKQAAASYGSSGSTVTSVKVTAAYGTAPTVQKSYGSTGSTVVTSQPAVQASYGSNRYSTSELRSLIQQARPGGWQGPRYADVSPRSMAKQHLVGSEHGFTWDQVSGLSQEEALILHDLAPRHGNKIFPYRTGQAVQAQPVQQVISQSYFERPSLHTGSALRSDFSSGCPNGQCARQAQPVRFGFFRRR